MTQEARFDVGTFDSARFDSVYYTENIATSETFNKYFIFLLDLYDNLTTTDSILKDISSQLTDALSLNDAIYKASNINLIDSISTASLLSNEAQKNIIDNVNAIDTNITKDIIKLLTDLNNITDDFMRVATLFRTLSDNIGALDTIQKEVNKSLTDNSTSTDSILRDIKVYFEDISNITDIHVWTWIKEFIETITTTDNTICLNRISGVIDEIKTDFETVLFDLMNESVQLIKTTTTKDGGFIDDISSEEFCIQCRIMPMSQKDRNMIPLGQVTTGTMTGYFLPSYTYNGTSYKVEENDEIYDLKKSTRYRVISIVQEEHLNNQVIYIKGLLHRI